MKRIFNYLMMTVIAAGTMFYSCETTELEDGSVELNFDPNAASPEGGDEHYANLAEFLDDRYCGLIIMLNSEIYHYC